MSDFLRNLYKKAVPVNIRTLGESVLGNKEPITEADFSPEELEVLRQMHAKRQGYQSYFDYPSKEAQRGAGFTFDGPLDLLYKSYTDPAFRVMSTLGSYNSRDIGDYVQAEDRYNFDAHDMYKIQPDTSHSTMLKRARQWWDSPAGLADMLLSRYRPDLDREVKIKVKK